MAMEISHHSKRLYKHAVPVVVLSIVLLLISALIFVKSSSLSSGGQPAISRIITSPFVHIKASDNGLAKFSGPNQQDINPQVGTEITSTGQTAGQSFTVTAPLN